MVLNPKEPGVQGPKDLWGPTLPIFDEDAARAKVFGEVRVKYVRYKGAARVMCQDCVEFNREHGGVGRVERATFLRTEGDAARATTTPLCPEHKEDRQLRESR